MSERTPTFGPRATGSGEAEGTAGPGPAASRRESKTARRDDRLLSVLAPRLLWSWPPFWRYALAAVLTAAATLLRQVFVPTIGTAEPYNFALVAQVLATVFLGIGPGLFTVVLSDLAVEAFFLRSLPALLEGPTLLRLGVSMAVGAFIAGLLHAIRVALIRAHRSETLQRAAREELAESEARYRGVVQNTSAVILRIDPQGRIRFANDRALSFFGYAKDELIGRPAVGTIVPERETSGRDLAAMVDEIRENPDRFHSNANENVRKTGERVWLEWTNSGLYDRDGRLTEFLSVGIDATERKRAEAELARTNQKINDILTSIQDDFYVLDRNWVFAYANRNFTSKVGKEPGDFVGRNIWEMFPKHVGTELEENFRAAMERREIRRFETGGRYTDAWYSLTAFPSPEGITVLGTDISETWRARKALEESERRLALAVGGTGIGLFDWDVATGEVAATDQVLKLLGLRPTTTTTTTMLPHRIGYRDWAERIHPEDLPAVEAEIRRCQTQRMPFEADYRVVWPDGGFHWLIARGIFVSGAGSAPTRFLGILIDGTERKKAEGLRQALAEQEKFRLGAAVEQASDAVVMIDLDGTIRYVNAAFEAIDRIPRAEALGRSYFDLPADEASAAALREALVLGRPWSGPSTRTIRGGPPIELDVTLSPAADASGTVIGGLITEKDVTRENALERQVRQAQKMEALGTLAGGITHDFNNILGSIIINTELALLDIEPGDRARRPLPLVLQAANRGKELVKQIITFSRQRAWERRPVLIAPIIREGMRFLRSTLSKNLDIRESIGAGNESVLADPSHIHQILVNLCQNAALAMLERGGDLEVRLEAVDVDAAWAGRRPELKPGPFVRLAVADTGCGMSREVRERIFEPFFTTRGPGEGSGLGLAVVHGILQSYGGAITVDSEPGKGSLFEVYLPRLEKEPAEARPAAPAEPAGGRERILLVEDDTAQRESLAVGLERLGYRVTTRAAGQTALSLFAREPGAFDLVVTDQIMPRMTGLELAAALIEVRPDILVILCTGFSEKVDERTVGRAGIRALVMKPFTIKEMARLIRKTVAEGPGGETPGS